MGEVLVSVDEAHALVEAALTASATSAPNAVSVARALVGAELAGQGGHQ
ncbi:MAG: Ldh family oxidoreductase, partial [Rhizobiaceae bacterium]